MSNQKSTSKQDKRVGKAKATATRAQEVKTESSDDSLQVTSTNDGRQAIKANCSGKSSVAPNKPTTITFTVTINPGGGSEVDGKKSDPEQSSVQTSGSAGKELPGKPPGEPSSTKQNPSAFLPTSSALPSLLSQPQFPTQMSTVMNVANSSEAPLGEQGSFHSQMPRTTIGHSSAYSQQSSVSSSQMPDASSSTMSGVDRDASSVAHVGSSSIEVKQNFFEQCKAFPDLEQPGSRIRSADYLVSVMNLSDFIGKFGLVFWTVRTDMQRNARVVQQFYWSDTAGCKYLDDLINKAKVPAKSDGWFGGWSSGSASTLDVSTASKVTPIIEGLMWTHRTIAFFAHVLRALVAEREMAERDPHLAAKLNDDLRSHFREAWQVEVEPAATWLMKMLFEAVISGAPTRSQFFREMAGTGVHHLSEEAMFAHFRDYMRSLEVCCHALKQCFIQHGYDI